MVKVSRLPIRSEISRIFKKSSSLDYLTLSDKDFKNIIVVKTSSESIIRLKLFWYCRNLVVNMFTFLNLFFKIRPKMLFPESHW